jgi:hypothetical protein
VNDIHAYACVFVVVKYSLDMQRARHRKQLRERIYHQEKEYRIQASYKQERTISESKVNRRIRKEVVTTSDT